MKNLIAAIFILGSQLLIGQEASKNEVFDKIVRCIEKSQSNFDEGGLHVVENADIDNFTTAIKTISESSVKKCERTFVLDWSLFVDNYGFPTETGRVLIVNFKEPVSIKLNKLEFRNVFHDDVTTEDFSEKSDFWFVFNSATDAEEMEKLLVQLKNILDNK